MKLTVVVAVHGKQDVFMSKVESNTELCDDALLKGVVQIMAVSALEAVASSIDELEGSEDGPGPE